MEKSEFCVLIKHYFLREKSIKETEEKLEKYYKESKRGDFSRTVCPDLTRERYAHNAKSSTYVRMVARAA